MHIPDLQKIYMEFYNRLRSPVLHFFKREMILTPLRAKLDKARKLIQPLPTSPSFLVYQHLIHEGEQSDRQIIGVVN